MQLREVFNVGPLLRAMAGAALVVMSIGGFAWATSEVFHTWFRRNLLMADEFYRRETGLGVILISHNMADVQAVADRIVVLRLGKNAAEFRVEDATTEELVAAITGASDNVVASRASRHAASTQAQPTRAEPSQDGGQDG